MANVGDDRNWTGSQFNQANWYAFGRLAWNPDAVVDGDRRRVDSHDVHERRRPRSRRSATMMLHVARSGRELHDAARPRAHHGDGTSLRPGAVGRRSRAPTGRRRTTTRPTRSASASTARRRAATRSRSTSRRCASGIANRDDRPDSLLLWFHHVPWTYRCARGRTLWDELVVTVQRRRRLPCGRCRSAWDVRAARPIDAARFADVTGFLAIQEREARWWRDAALTYFQTFSRHADPGGLRAAGASARVLPAHSLSGRSRQAALRRDSLIHSCITARERDALTLTSARG